MQSMIYCVAHDGKITAVVVESGQSYSASTDGSVKKWNCNDLSLIKTFEGDHGTVNALALFDQKLFAGSSLNRTIQFDLETGKMVQNYDFKGSVEKLVVQDNEIIAVVYGTDNLMVHIDIKTQAELLKYKVHFNDIVALQADSKNLYIVSGSGRFIEVRRRSDGSIVGWLSGKLVLFDMKLNLGQNEIILSLHLQKNFLLSGSSDKTIQSYDVNKLEFPETAYNPSRIIDGNILTKLI